MRSAFYQAPIHQFLTDCSNGSLNSVLGDMASENHFDLVLQQKRAWKEEIELFKKLFEAHPDWHDGYLIFEYTVPRLCSRIDTIVFLKGIGFILEFKVGEASYPKDAVSQVLNYCLDLKYFHEASRTLPLVPVVVCTKAANVAVDNEILPYWNGIYRPLYCHSAASVQACIERALASIGQQAEIDASAWMAAVYSPTPTIIEAARSLYANHEIEDITKTCSDDDVINLNKTMECVNRIIDDSRSHGKKSILLLTGVPGAGKTLVGLNIAIQRHKMGISKDAQAVFLSGNDPLVKVLQKVFYDDASKRTRLIKSVLKKETGENTLPGEVAEYFKSALEKTFVRPVRAFRNDYLKIKYESGRAPGPKDAGSHIAVFDEAQRAWTRERLASWGTDKLTSAIGISEPECLIEQIDLNPDWATMVCLVGGGQEIHRGEAGIAEWLRAINDRFPEWEVYLSDYMNAHPDMFDVHIEGTTRVTEEFARLRASNRLHVEPSLHLGVSQRSFRSEAVSDFANQLVCGNAEAAGQCLRRMQSAGDGCGFPVYLTRDLKKAKAWIRENAKSLNGIYLERFGVVASSQAFRLRPEGIEMSKGDRDKLDIETWMLGDAHKIDSSYYMELAASELNIQGLELDYTLVAWEGDFVYSTEEHQFKYYKFRASTWNPMAEGASQDYLRNAYRVILTRARQGMVLYVPKGDASDPTRIPSERYDGTYEYLKSVGIPEL